jgi:hypothetical protein
MDWKEKPMNSLIAATGVLIFGALIHCIIILMHLLRGSINKLANRKYKTVSKSSTREDLEKMEAQYHMGSEDEFNFKNKKDFSRIPTF